MSRRFVIRRFSLDSHVRFGGRSKEERGITSPPSTLSPIELQRTPLRSGHHGTEDRRDFTESWTWTFKEFVTESLGDLSLHMKNTNHGGVSWG